MEKTKIIVALGGNALEEAGSPATAEAQLAVVKKTCTYLAELASHDYDMAIVHGNGPQVGRILLASETAREVTPPLPFDVCGAMTQGYIGYHIQQSLKEALAKVGKGHTPVVTLVTQMVVEKDDPGFLNPSKPIGPFYTEAEAQVLMAERGFTMKEDAGRGWRRVVASPIPKEIAEIDSILKLWGSTICIACGGGGIPVIRQANNELSGVAAVIDKDFAAALLAKQVDADILIILTEVENVALNFNTPEEQPLRHITVAEAERYIAEGHFAAGSMLPKVKAAVQFARVNPAKKAIITSLYKGTEALAGQTGTLITLE